MAKLQIPSTGRIVHYFWADEEGIEYAALITGVVPPAQPYSAVDLVIFGTTNMTFQTGVPHRSLAEGQSCWDWPSHVAPVEVPDGE